MSGYIPNMWARDGELAKLQLSKRVGETHAHRAARIASALRWISHSNPQKNKRYFAIRYGGTWHIYREDFPVPLKTDMPEDAAAMWLLHHQ